MAIIREEYFMNTNIEANSNKIWIIQEHDNCSVTSRYGRVGDSLQEKTWAFPSQAKASAHYEKKKREKLRVKTGRDAYTKVEVLDSVQSTSTVVTGNLAEVAKKQIETTCPETKKLIAWLTKINVHQILSTTTMTYNADEGVFRTPLGVIGQTSIDQAHDYLAAMKSFVAEKKYDDDQFKKIVNQYLRLIPQDLGRAREKLKLERIFPDMSAFDRQVDLVQKLEASIQSLLTSSPQGGSEERVFNAKLTPVSNDDIVKEISRLYEKTRQSRHTSYSYQPYKIWEVDIQKVREAYEKDGAKLSNIWRLWHGTKPHNLLSILKVGLIIPKTYTNGWAFGPGVYFSDQSTKSLGYSTGYWDGKAEGRAFMFLADVGMGKIYNTSSTIRTPPAGYDSCFARGSECRDPKFQSMTKCGSLLNNEMIAYRSSLANLVYLVEFRKP